MATPLQFASVNLLCGGATRDIPGYSSENGSSINRTGPQSQSPYSTKVLEAYQAFLPTHQIQQIIDGGRALRAALISGPPFIQHPV